MFSAKTGMLAVLTAALAVPAHATGSAVELANYSITLSAHPSTTVPNHAIASTFSHPGVTKGYNPEPHASEGTPGFTPGGYDGAHESVRHHSSVTGKFPETSALATTAPSDARPSAQTPHPTSGVFSFFGNRTALSTNSSVRPTAPVQIAGSGRIASATVVGLCLCGLATLFFFA